MHQHKRVKLHQHRARLLASGCRLGCHLPRQIHTTAKFVSVSLDESIIRLLTDADDLSDSSETGWEWLAALSQKTNKPLPPMQSLSGFNPLFMGDIARAPSPSSHSFRRSQSFNPVFNAQHAQHEQLEVDSNAWQLHGMMANSRTNPQEMSSLAWNHSASSSSIVAVPAPTAEAEPRLTTDGAAAEEGAFADSMARLLAGDRQDSADWVSSSSSSDDVSPPVRSLSLPNALLEAAIRREGVALDRPLGRDTSLPVSVQSGFDPALWSTDQKPASVSTLRQRFIHQQQQQQQPKQADVAVQEAAGEQPDIWAALERQPSPVITLRQRYMQAQQQLQGQGSTLQPGQAVLDLMPEDIVLQEASTEPDVTAGIGLPSGAYGHPKQAPPLDSGHDEGDRVHQAPDGMHQQTGLPPQYPGMSARAARRHLQKLPTALFSEPQPHREEALDRGVRFGSGTVAADEPEADWQQAPQLPRARSSMKQQRSPRGSLRKRSFRRQGSSVSFAAASTASDDSSGESGASVSGKSKARAGLQGAVGLAAPLVKTVSSVWAMISSGLAPTPAVSAQSAVYQPARSDSPDLEADLPHGPSARPPRPRSGSALWQIASKSAAAGQMAPQIAAQPAQRSLSRFGSFWEVVAQASTTRPSLASNLGREHLELGVKMLLEAKQKAGQKGSRLDSLRSPGSKHASDWGGRLDIQQSLAKVMQVLSAKQMGKSVSMASTVQV